MMTINLSETLRRYLATDYPTARDCSSESLMEFNRHLEQRMDITGVPNSILAQFTFPESGLPWQVDHHAWCFGRLVYLRATFEMSGFDSIMENPHRRQDAIDQRFCAFNEQLQTWGNCAYYTIRPLPQSPQVAGLFLVDPLTLNLIVADNHGRATVRGTRFRVSQLIQLGELLKSAPQDWMTQDVNTETWMTWQGFNTDPRQLRDEIYSQLTSQQLHAAFAYWHMHREEIERTIQDEQRLIERHLCQDSTIVGGA